MTLRNAALILGTLALVAVSAWLGERRATRFARETGEDE